MVNRNGKTMYVRCHPKRIEYSEKDDKFRLVTAGWHAISTINISKIKNCVHYVGQKKLDHFEWNKKQDVAIIRVLDERNALERFMLSFAHFEKQAEKLDKKNYIVRIKYSHDDEPEMAIRMLSFGPLVEVLGSESLRNLVIKKLKDQKSRRL
jgi:predicted DNA-binding transcriptional regulator YafY